MVSSEFKTFLVARHLLHSTHSLDCIKTVDRLHNVINFILILNVLKQIAFNHYHSVNEITY